ncbi:MAG: ATP-binding protein, partial [Gammaproteobacteria bacterium]
QDNSKMQAAVSKVATSVSASRSSEFFETLARNMADAVGAEISFVTRLYPGEPVTARTITAVVDGSVIENFDYPLEDTPYEDYASRDEYVVDSRLIETYPRSPCARFGANAYVGRLLRNSVGRPIGVVSVGFRGKIHQTDFIVSALKIFGTRAAAELERLDAEHAHRLLEAQLIEAQKMEAIGTLAGGIAHDFNNILAAILGNTELALQDAGSNPNARESLEEIKKAGQRAKELVQQILSFSRRQPTERRAIGLIPVIEEAVRLLQATLPARVEVLFERPSFEPAVLGDITQIEQVLLNLGANAAYAMDGKPGRITIRCEGTTITSQADDATSGLQPGEYTCISVSDTGRGMEAATLQRIFEPFFTTKPIGKGTGLGLSAAHGIMRLHDGTIRVHSEPGKGSRFDLYFPVTQLQVAQSQPLDMKTGSNRGQGQRILYIDDDDAIVFLIKRMLERRGYQVSAYT